REVQDILIEQARRCLLEAELPRAGGMIVFDAPRLAVINRYLRREVVRLVWEREHWPMGEMDFSAWDRLADLAESVHGAADFPGGVRARRTGQVMQVGPAALLK